ncbi:MAG: ceramidase domain-containing protein [Alphaproteobacteria bacterium]|nr:ceramidase domain-containing protein [Alphaproteobacteria bacterium]MBV9692774.1 ceramidase domain-containing protein [Alphaproteobacteria bacterium]
MTPHGPIYCETGHPWLFMAEPVNTLTNIFIIIAAILALREVRRARIGMPLDLAVLLFLLFATGIGSFAWHGLRVPLALAFDALPGLLFLFAMAGLWFRALFGSLAGLLGAVGTIALAAASIFLWRRYGPNMQGMPPAFGFLPAFFAIAALGFVLAAVTRARFGAGVAALGFVAVLCGVAAATARSVDLLTCRTIPFGTHFLWHMLLSLAAYLGIVMLTRMKNSTPIQ